MELKGSYPYPMVPYQRLPGKLKWSKIGKRYHASQNALRLHMRLMCPGMDVAGGRWRAVPSPFRLDLTITVPPTKAGNIPKNRGDADNYLKAFLDAMVTEGIAEGDDLSRYRGGVLDVQMGDKWRFDWRLYDA